MSSPSPRPIAATSATTLVGGCGILLAMLFPLVAAVAGVFPGVFGLVLPPPGLQLVCWAVFALGCGILAFGMPGETGIVGPSIVGRTALFVFGLHRLVLDLASLLTPLPQDFALADPAELSSAMVGGYAGLAVSILGSLAGVVAAVAAVRSGVLHGVARWVLVPVAVVGAIGPALSSVPVQEVAQLAVVANALWFLLVVAAGAVFALHGRAPALRQRARQFDAWW